MTINVVLPVYVVDAALTADGVNLPPFQADASINLSELDLAPFVTDNSTTPRWLSSFTLPGETVVGIFATLPTLQANLTQSTLSASVPVPTASCTGYLGRGPITASLPKFTASLGLGMTFSATLPCPYGFLGDVTDSAIDGTIPLLDASVSGIMTAVVGINATLPLPASDVEGGPFAFWPSLPSISASFSSIVATTGSIAAQLPWARAAISAAPYLSAELGAEIPVPTATLSSARGIVAALDADIPALFSTISGAAGVIARISVEVTAPSVAFSGFTSSSATVTASLPRIDGRLDATGVVTQVATYVINTITNALSTYESFPFNSFAEINGKYYRAGPSGLFELVGDKDNGVDNISATISTGQDHFASEMQKRVSDFFIGMRAAGDITLRVMVDENDPLEYTLSPLDIETLKQRRTLIGKGAKGKYWQFELSNVDGCDFDFDSFNVAVVPLSRRL